MITVKLYTQQATDAVVIDLKKCSRIRCHCATGNSYISVWSDSDSVTEIPVSGNFVYIKVFGLPDYQGSGDKPHLEGLTRKVEEGDVYHVAEIFGRIDNEPILADYIKYRLFPGKFPTQKL